ncbi:MAG TPA: hypothetical protein VK622_01245 [Puia sp.]|nr:hypothetical protein [Puia sp.]
MVRLFGRIFIVLTLVIFISYARAQPYPFARDFAKGVIYFPDSTQKSGLIKWFPAQEEKLIFRENEKAPKQKFPPEELAGFQVDTFKFRSISGFQVYGNDFALLGKMSEINHTFGQLLDSGKVNSYLVYYSGYNALAGSAQSYLNILFEKKTDSGFVYAAYPVAMRMKDKKFEKVKDNLQSFFRDYPEIAEKIKTIQQQDGVTEILNMVRRLE